MCFAPVKYLEMRLNDPMCPMKKVHCVISDDNLYANIQKSDFPVLMNFDLEDKKKWSPFFDNNRKITKFFENGKIDTC